MMKSPLWGFAIVAVALFLGEEECRAFSPAFAVRTTRTTNNWQCSLPQQPITRLFAITEDEQAVAAISSSPKDRPVLAAIDLASLFVFAAVGKASHASDGSLDLIGTAITAAPFIASWFLTAPFTGVYEKLVYNADQSSTKDVAIVSFVQTFKGWALAVPLGCAARGVIKGYVPPVPFIVVTLLATLVLLGGTRALYAVIADKVST